MVAKPRHLDWLRANIEQHLSRVDEVIAAVMPATVGDSGVSYDEPWVEHLFERRQSVQSILFELEQQIDQRRAEASDVVELLAGGDDR
jgi:hypothetical protein